MLSNRDLLHMKLGGSWLSILLSSAAASEVGLVFGKLLLPCKGGLRPHTVAMIWGVLGFTLGFYFSVINVDV